MKRGNRETQVRRKTGKHKMKRDFLDEKKHPGII